uniref:Protein TsetseEP domain-containing protein n=1 Tax=Anopheles christyi TaxID=43041 RepID=A0A182JPU9_9DIPT
MRCWFVVLIGTLLCSGQDASANDPLEALGACSGNLFGLLMSRLLQQVEDYTACQQANAEDPNHNCSDSIQRATVDLQLQLVNYIDCTNSIR